MGPTSVSVIVPCYETERYLDDCLVSITEQTHRDLEIVAVDDGSIDRTPEILRRWADADKRIVLVSRTNGGLGAARNSGLGVATAPLLTFVDSDDVLPFDALERMVSTIERTGSDFVTGVADRFDGTRRWRASMYRRGFKDDLDQTHVYERPSLLNDHTIWSKLFRRSFWDEHGFAFPEGTLFEDIEVATRAHCLATSVDLLAEPTYLWRHRPVGDLSITQDRTRPGGVAARFAALRATDEFIRVTAPPNVWRRHGMKLVTIDVPLYARELDGADERFSQEFFRAAGPLLAEISPAALDSLGPMHRQLREAVIAGSPETTIALVRLLKPNGPADRIRGFGALSLRAQREIVHGAVRRRLPRRWPPTSVQTP